MSDARDAAAAPGEPERIEGNADGAGQPPERGHGGARLQDRILYLLLAVLVAVSGFLATYTTWIHHRTGVLRSTQEKLVSPGARLTQDLIIAVSLEMQAIVEAPLSVDGLAELEHRAAVRRATMTRLDSIVRQMEGGARLRLDDLSRSLDRWESFGPGAVGRSRPSVDGDVDRALDELWRQILLDATALQRTLYAEVERSRAQIDEAEQVDWYLTLGLALVTLAAAAFIAWLVRRIREIARVSERRRLEAHAAIADRARLIRGISHDVKNPLGAADGSAALLEMGIGGPLNEDQRETVKRIRRGIGGALSIVTDLLELSRIEADTLSIDPAPTNVGALLSEIAEDYRPSAQAAGLSLTATIPAGLPLIVTDGRRVRQIIGNLLSNAIKYTPAPGRVGMTADVRRGGAASWLAVEVEDTGPGIPTEEQARVFEEFYRSGDPSSRPAGTGVGLAIGRRVARLLGGDLVVESEPGRGSRFTLSLPAEKATPARLRAGLTR